MRTYGRIGQTNGQGGTWVEVSSVGTNDEAVWLTELVQYLRLVSGESPFYANAGIPAYQSIITQTFPDFAVMQAQQFFSPFFASIAITRQAGSVPPVYDAAITLVSGTPLILTVPT